MRNGLTAQQASRNALGRAASVALAGVMAMALAACTTVEGGNALTDIGTFEREVMSSTARGVGLIPAEAPKEDLTTARAPLVLPTSNQALPAPGSQAAVAQLPTNSDTVQIDTAGLSEADIARLRNAKVVDLNSVAGRPLTEEEARTLMARMQKNNLDVSVANSERPLYMPPAEYFTRVGNAELVCSIGNGQVVSLNDARCPEDVRKAIQDARRRATGPLSAGTAISNTQGVGLTDSETGQ